jgi:hypothetical protein
MTALKLDPRLDAAAIKPLFQKFGRLHIPDVLPRADAARVHAAMSHAPWTRTFLVSGKGYRVALDDFAKSPPEVRDQVEAAIAEGARTGFMFDFDNWAVSDDLEAGRRRGGEVEAIEAAYDLMNSQPCLDFLRKITGEPRIAYVDAQASRYRAGQFLTAHDDEIEGKNRLFAYVLNLTPAWRVEWGGLLLFHDADGHVSEGYAPKFNALNIFKVPQWHSVSQVASYVTEPRLSITGWIRSKAP